MSQREPEYTLLAPLEAGFASILTPDALQFVSLLAARFTPEVVALLERRRKFQRYLDDGGTFDFDEITRPIRQAPWTVAPLPTDLLDRRVEITGPVDRKMIINALNSGANCFMADFEDAASPTWHNMIQGQINLRDAVNGTISYHDPRSDRHYTLSDNLATLIVRPRGWHLWEKHLTVNGHPVPAGLVDFGLYIFHNAHALLRKGTGPYFYLPKMEHHTEARIWNEVFLAAQELLDIPAGTIKATVLIETLPAVFQMDEILYELKEHSAGLNCGRWDYIFSIIKKFHNDPGHILPDRQQISMGQHCMQAYSRLLIQTCHKRNVHAIGGMAAQIPIKGDPQANHDALEEVRYDKLREVQNGHDGTWVAHPALIPVAREVFDKHMPWPNQIHRKLANVSISAEDLLELPQGTRTEAGLREDIRVSIQYIEDWLHGIGAVPLYHLMEDAATAEISRSQAWQWLHHHVRLDDGKPLTRERFIRIMQDEMQRIRSEVGDERFESGYFRQASKLFQQLCLSPDFADFLTLSAYEELLAIEKRQAA